MGYAHVLVLQGHYREVLRIYDGDVFRADRTGNLIPHFIAGSGQTIALLRMGHLGEVLRTARTGRALAEKNGTSSLMHKFREAWLRILAFDFGGARRICDAISEAEAKVEPYAGQQRCIGRIAAGYMELHRGEYGRALDHFRLGAEHETAQKFFLRWAWRMTAQMELGNAWLLARNIQNARASADTYLQAALSTADPHLQALAWDLSTRLAMAENNWTGARECIEKALAIVDSFEILVAAWQVHATAWQLCQNLNEYKKAEKYREDAASCILKIANTFEPGEPLRASFLAAPPVARVLGATATGDVQS